jgi:predicted signal transduction protein with EAL and GGDEF domain
LAQRIVIVDDTALNRRVLESLIQELDDVEVLSFASSAEALERAPLLGAACSSQAAFLRDAGCALGQGYFYGRPMPADAFDALSKRQIGEAIE